MKRILTICAFCLSLTAMGESAEPLATKLDREAFNENQWNGLTDDVFVTWTSRDVLQKRCVIPHDGRVTTDTTVHVWRGERVGMQLAIYAKKDVDEPLRLEGAQPLRYVISDAARLCGDHPQDLAPFTVAAIVDNQSVTNVVGGEVRQAWCTVEVPRDANSFVKTVKVVGTVSGRVYGTLKLRLDVSKNALPEPKDYTFHLDLWQQPYAVSRYYGVENWSAAHFALMRPYMEQLARAGQKVVSAIMFYEPWGKQSNDKFQPMVQVVKKADGKWSYDYEIFDKWVEFMADCGIDKQINCYSMIPWDMTFRYFDEKSDRFVDVKTKTNTEEYKDIWSNFLTAFAAHLKQKGWFDKTCMAMDERNKDDMQRAYSLVKTYAPGLKVSLAGSHHPELVPLLQDYCVGFAQTFTDEEFAQRRKAGQTTTIYTCCSEKYPNIFSNSDPIEAVYLPVYANVAGFDGYLHWSWINWTDDPLVDTRFKLFSSGDTYFFYPGPRSSVHFERLVEGVQQFEKLNVLKKTMGKDRKFQKLMKDLKNADPSKASELVKLIGELELY